MRLPHQERAAGSPLSRRRLLQLGGATGLVLVGGSALLMWGGGAAYRGLLPAGLRPRVLSEKALAVLFAVVDRLIPDAPGRLTARQARIAERLDRELAFHPAKLRSDFNLVLLLVEHGGLVHASPARFTRLSPQAQDARLAAMAKGNAVERQAYAALKTVVHFFYYCDERTWPGIHYDGPLVSVRSPPPADSRPEP